MPLTISTGVDDVLTFLRGILQDNLSDEIKNLGLTSITAPEDTDIQIGPEFAFGGDPVIGITWVSNFLMKQLAPREERKIRCKFDYFSHVSQGTQTGAQIIAESERALWYTIHRHYRQESPTVIYIEHVESRPISRETPGTGLVGYGVEMLLDVLVWFILPPKP